MHNDVKSELVRSAAFLRREFLGRNNFEKKENTIYIYDTDVIKASCAPWLAGPGRDQGGNGYGEPISFVDPAKKKIKIDLSKRKQKAERVSKILSSHGLELAGDFPLYQFNLHFDKTTEIYGYVRNDAERHARTDTISQRDRQRRDIIQMSALIASRQNEKKSYHLSFEAELLMQILNNSVYSVKSEEQRSIKEWDAFIDLNKKHGGIFPISQAAQHFARKSEIKESSNKEISAVAKAIEGFHLESFNSNEYNNYEVLRNFWKNSPRFINTERSERSESIDSYADCLALLGLLNCRLSPIGWRAVFVTGSTSLTDAAYSSLPQNIEDILGSVGQDFGNRFVRHIWAYTSEALIEPHNQAKFVNWLDGLLGKWAGKSSFKTNELNTLRIHKNFKEVTVSDCREAFESWDERTSNMVAQHNFFSISKQNNTLKEKLIYRIEKSRQQKLGWDEISNLLLEDNDRENDEAFLLFSNIGVDALISAQQTSRHPPDLDFESLAHTKKIFSKLTSKDGYESRQEFEKDFDAIKYDCFPPEVDNRQFSHLRYLALGAAFASASRWSVALSQAQRAIRIVVRSKERNIWPIQKKDGANSYMSGREAYFLAAVSLRMIAKKSSDFATSAQFLDDAYKALIDDRAKKTAKNFDDLRFLNEKCAHALSVYYFNRMKNENDFQNKTFQSAILNLENILNSVSYFEYGHQLKDRRAVTLAHVALNTIQVHAIKEFRDFNGIQSPSSKVLEKNTLQSAISILQDLSGDGQQQNARLFKTKLMICYSLVGSLLLNGTASHSSEEIKKAFEGWEKTVVTEYDRWRYVNLRALADKIMKKK